MILYTADGLTSTSSGTTSQASQPSTSTDSSSTTCMFGLNVPNVPKPAGLQVQTGFDGDRVVVTHNFPQLCLSHLSKFVLNALMPRQPSTFPGSLFHLSITLCPKLNFNQSFLHPSL